MAATFDGVAAFELINPDKLAITCVGNTQQGRRCRNPIAYHDVAAAKQILATITQYFSDAPQLRRRLRALAALCICKNSRCGHISQQETIVSRWMAVVRLAAPIQQHRLFAPATAVEPNYSCFAGGLISRDLARPGTRIIYLRAEQVVIRAQATVPAAPVSTTAARPRPSTPPARAPTPAQATAAHRISTIEPATETHTTAPQPSRGLIIGAGNIALHDRVRALAASRTINAAPPPPALSVQDTLASGTELDDSVAQLTVRRSARLAAQRHTEASTTIPVPAASQNFQGRAAGTVNPTTPAQAGSHALPSQRVNTTATQTSTTSGIETCSICLDPVTEARETPCGHIYCGTCITTWLDHSSTCPLDRRHLTPSQLRRPTRVLRKPIEGECPMCYEDIGSPSEETTVWCRSQCGTNFHRRCMNDWHESEEDRSTCPYCRAEWQE